jgi:two-component system cell cycle response regulator
MSARILVVDDNPLNVKLLAAKLARDYYFVTSAENGVACLEKAETEHPDLILLDIMMPEMDGFEACERLKANPVTRHIPVVMVTALSDTADRVRGLEAGADDFLTKPINDVALMARVRSLLRLKMMMDEWRLREATAAQFNLPAEDDAAETKPTGHILLLEDNVNDQQIVTRVLDESGFVHDEAMAIDEVVRRSGEGTFDLVMTSLDLKGEDGLLLCAQLRAQESTRNLPILLIANEGEIDLVAKGLDLGANDYLLRPIEGSELIARTRTQVRQKRHYDRLRRNYERSLELALVDPLTGAYNRRYLEQHLPKMFARARDTKRPLSVLSFDLDHFKSVNDTYGHDAGDVVLKTVVERVTKSLRPMDLVVRMGGEEFAVIMPETEPKTALAVGERLRKIIESAPVSLPGRDEGVPVTISLGISSLTDDAASETPERLLKRADQALYKAKEGGRNRVVGADELG